MNLHLPAKALSLPGNFAKMNGAFQIAIENPAQNLIIPADKSILLNFLNNDDEPHQILFYCARKYSLIFHYHLASFDDSTSDHEVMYIEIVSFTEKLMSIGSSLQ